MITLCVSALVALTGQMTNLSCQTSIDVVESAIVSPIFSQMKLAGDADLSEKE